MDGNARWAKKQGLTQQKGHSSGLRAAKNTILHALSKDIPYLSLFSFSKENWGRPKSEVNYLFKIFTQALSSEVQFLVENKIKVKFIGDLEELPEIIKHNVQSCLQQTSFENSKLQLGLAVNYGGRQDLLQAFEKVKAVEKPITEELIASHLLTHPFPPPDLIVRTGNRSRLSNFFLWQAAYSELFFSQKFWPDFSESDFDEALSYYQKTPKNFGVRPSSLIFSTENSP